MKKTLAFLDLYGIIINVNFVKMIPAAKGACRGKGYVALAENSKNMYDKIVEIIANQLQIDADTIDENTKIMEELGADSLDVVEMLMAMEESFGITIPDEDIEELVTVSDIVDYVESNI